MMDGKDGWHGRHILIVHQNFPAQFATVGPYLAARGARITFVTHRRVGGCGWAKVVNYKRQGGAKSSNHYFTRGFENCVASAHGVYEACKSQGVGRPDVVLAHSGFGSSLYLAQLYGAPIVNLFEYYYSGDRDRNTYRSEFPPRDVDLLRAVTGNAMMLLDLDLCSAGYSPTAWQKSRFPLAFQGKIAVCHDGIDVRKWSRMRGEGACCWRGLPAGVRLVTFVSRGLESMRGFDVFARVVDLLARYDRKLIFVAVGGDRVCYGNDPRFLRAGQTFREHAMELAGLRAGDVHFTGTIPDRSLVDLLSASSLHMHLSAEFVPSWSLLNAMSCEAPVVASRNAAMEEIVQHGVQGFLAPLDSPVELAERAMEVLDSPVLAKALGMEARSRVESKYAVDVCAPRIAELLRGAME